MRLAVIIPTTDRPVQIERITRLTRAPLSQVVTSDDFVPNAEMASRYHALVDQSGPLRGLINLNGVRFELCLDRLPDMGRSWELAVAVAHWGLDNGHQLVSTDPDLVIWATGVVTADRRIADEDYQLDFKREASHSILMKLGESAQLVVLLPGNTAETQVGQIFLDLDSAVVKRVSNVDAAVDTVRNTIDGMIHSGDGPESSSRFSTIRSAHKWFLKAAVFLALLVAVGAYALIQSAPQEEPIKAPFAATAPKNQLSEPHVSVVSVANEPTDSDLDPNEVSLAMPADQSEDFGSVLPHLVLVEHRAPAGSSCADVLFGGVSATMVELHAKSGEFRGSDLSGLCALSFELDGAPTGTLLNLPSDFLARTILSDREKPAIIGGIKPQMFHIVERASELQYQPILTTTKRKQVTYRHRLTGR